MIGVYGLRQPEASTADRQWILEQPAPESFGAEVSGCLIGFRDSHFHYGLLDPKDPY